MSSREPLWYCYECNAEMRPLMVPDPHCASCNGTFVEKLENPEDDPREFQHVHDAFDEDALPPNMDGFLTGLRALMRGFGPNTTAGTDPTPAAQRSQSEGPGGRPDRMGMGEGSGLTIRIQGSPDGRARAMFIGGSRPPRGADNVPPLFSEFMARGPNPRRDAPPDAREDPNTITGPLMAQYLLAMLANRPGQQGGEHINDLFGGLFGAPEGAENGRWGDYVFNQEALDQIITQIMENSNSNAPVPATEEIMKDLPRTVLEEGSPLLEKDCAVCKDQFKLDVEDADERIVVTLPCKHSFHESCIMPWLKSSGTCPVCRYQLVPQPEHHTPGPGPPGGSGSGNDHSPSDDDYRRHFPSPGGRGINGGGGLFSSLFGFAGGSSGSNGNNNNNNNNNSSQGPSGNQSRNDSNRPTQENNNGSIPGGWSEQLD